MDGLELQAQKEASLLPILLSTRERVVVKHSSRLVVIQKLAAELLSSANTVVTRCLVLSSGISPEGVALLQQALSQASTIHELHLVGITGTETLQSALACCAVVPHLQTLHLRRYNPTTSLGNREEVSSVAQALRDGMAGLSSSSKQLTTLAIISYPLGTEGAALLATVIAHNTTWTTLLLQSCSLQSDSAMYVAQMIRTNTGLQTLDLTNNRWGTELTREMAYNTMVQHGLQSNVTLQQLVLEEAVSRVHPRPPKHTLLVPDQQRLAALRQQRHVQHRPTARWTPLPLPVSINHHHHKKPTSSMMDRQLAMNQFVQRYFSCTQEQSTEQGQPQDGEQDPWRTLPTALWPVVLARVSDKPAALYMVLQHSAVVACFS